MLRRFPVLLLALAGAVGTGPVTAAEFIDLTRAGALEDLETSNPAHFARIIRIIADLREEPERAEGNWLEVAFDVRDVDLSRLLIRTSHPPKQSLTFTLDTTRYRLFVTRTDLAAEVIPAH